MKRHIMSGVMDVTGWIVLGVAAVALVWVVFDALRDKHKFIQEDVSDG